MTSMHDLHTHSTASDGTLSPTALVERAASAGVTHLALTDHDTTAGLDEAREAAAAVGVVLVPGVEISVTWNARTIHVVGLQIDATNPVLQNGLAGIMDFRDWRAEEMGRRLARHGIQGAYEGAKALSGGTLVGRMHFARYLVERRVAEDTGAVFRQFLRHGKPGHVAGQWAALESAIGWIRAAGGQAVLAHPGRYDLTRTRMLSLLGEFREVGGVGLEVVTSTHGRDDAFKFARYSREQRLLASVGSDFHGPENSWFQLGRLPPLPEGCQAIWRDWPQSAVAAPKLRTAVG